MAVSIVLQPGVADTLATPLRLVVREPATSSLAFLVLVEADAWEIDGAHAKETDGDTNTPIAILLGKIENRQFKLQGGFVGPAAPLGLLLLLLVPPLAADLFRTADRLKAAPSDPNQSVLRFQIDGDSSTFLIPFKDNDFSREGGYFEILAAIAADSGPGRQPEGFISPIPAFVRTIPAARRVAAFITAPDEPATSGNPFFRFARRYWHQVTDRSEDLFTLGAIFEFLRDHATDSPAGPWGEVNIVSHGNEREWFVKAFDNSDLRMGRKDVESLSNEPRHPFFAKFPESVMDASTIVVLRGCQIGKDQALLDAIRVLFGGNATILAPKFIQQYGQTATGLIETFIENFVFFVPGRTPPPPLQCQQRIAKEHPPLTVQDVAAMERHFSPDNLEHNDVGPFTRGGQFNTELDGKSNVQIAAFLLPLVKEDFTVDPDDPTEFTDWGDWTAQDVQREPRTGHVQSVTMRGFRTGVEFRRPLRHNVNGASVLVVPNIHNPDHYGRSPAF